MTAKQRLVIEMDTDRNGYGDIHREGCRDVKDPEPLGEHDSLSAANLAADDLTGWENASYHFAPCVRLPWRGMWDTYEGPWQ